VAMSSVPDAPAPVAARPMPPRVEGGERRFGQPSRTSAKSNLPNTPSAPLPPPARGASGRRYGPRPG
jgi:hypothetical protein